MLTTLKKRQQFISAKINGKSWATECFIVQGLIHSPLNSQKSKVKQKKQPLSFSKSTVIGTVLQQTDDLETSHGPTLIEPINKLSNNPHPSQIGFTATKHLGNAVKRNRAKRRLREVCRLHIHLLQQENIDYVFIARDKILTCTFDELQRNFQWALKHLHRVMEI